MRKPILFLLATGLVIACGANDPAEDVALSTDAAAVSHGEERGARADSLLFSPVDRLAFEARFESDDFLFSGPLPLLPDFLFPSIDVELCGLNVCGAGEFCCNASCGICAPVGGACTQQVCAFPGVPAIPPVVVPPTFPRIVIPPFPIDIPPIAVPPTIPPFPTDGEICGNAICGVGEFCCNESCGICAPLGGVCTQQICTH